MFGPFRREAREQDHSGRSDDIRDPDDRLLWDDAVLHPAEAEDQGAKQRESKRKYKGEGRTMLNSHEEPHRRAERRYLSEG